MSNLKKLSFAVSTLTLLAIGSVAFSVIGPAHSAQARELVDRSMAKAIKISPEMRKEIEAKIKADMEATLEEARAAKDLKTISKEEADNLLKLHEGAKGVIGFSHRVEKFERATNTEDVIFSKAGRAEKGEKVLFVNKGEGIAHAGVPFGGPVIKEAKTYLSYTDPKGRSVVLGLDDEDTVVMKMMRLNETEMTEGPDGMIGFPAEKREIFIRRIE